MQQVIQVKSDPGHGKRKIPQKALSRRTVRSRIHQLSGQHADDMTDSKSPFCSTDLSFVILTFSFFPLFLSQILKSFLFLGFFPFLFFFFTSPVLILTILFMEGNSIFKTYNCSFSGLHVSKIV